MNTNIRFGGTFIINTQRLSNDAKREIGYHLQGAKLYEYYDEDTLVLDSAGRAGDHSTGWNMADETIADKARIGTLEKGNRAYMYIPEALSEKSKEYRQSIVNLAKQYFSLSL